MAVSWLFPLGLVGLAALLLPLLLHLARRREQRVLRFAAMRWLPAGRAPRRRLRLQERRLLALRLLLLAIAALWLAQPLLRDFGTPQHWLAVLPSVDPAAAKSSVGTFDRAVWLAPGLPAVEDGQGTITGATRRDSWTSLLQEFAARLPAEDTVTVLAPAAVSGLGDQLPAVWHSLDWREAPAAQPAEAEAPPRLLALRYTDADSPALPRLRAAIAAWDEDPQLRLQLDDAPATTPVPPQADAVLWAGPLPERATDPAIPLVHVPGLPSLSALYEPDFPRRLHADLFGTTPPDRGPATLLHRLPVAEPVGGRADAAPLSPRGLRDLALSPQLAWLLLALFLLERWMASGRRLGRAP